jgi:hypothetical protein
MAPSVAPRQLPQRGSICSAHGSAPSRGCPLKSLERDAERRTPSGVWVVSTVSTKPSAPRSPLSGEPSRARGFNPLPTLRPPTGGPGRQPQSRTHRRFQPVPAAPPKPSPPAFRPDVSGSPCWIRRESASPRRDRRALPARPPLTSVPVVGRTPFPRCQLGTVWGRAGRG